MKSRWRTERHAQGRVGTARGLFGRQGIVGFFPAHEAVLQ